MQGVGFQLATTQADVGGAEHVVIRRLERSNILLLVLIKPHIAGQGPGNLSTRLFEHLGHAVEMKGQCVGYGAGGAFVSMVDPEAGHFEYAPIVD